MSHYWPLLVGAIKAQSYQKEPPMPINHWPQEDRPREKLLTKGEHALTDAELLAIIFNNGMRGKSALDIAKELLSEHGDLKKLLCAPAVEIAAKPGLGNAK